MIPTIHTLGDAMVAALWIPVIAIGLTVAFYLLKARWR